MGTSAKSIIQDALVELGGSFPGRATKVFQDYLLDLDREIPSYSPLVVTDFGASGNGSRDDTAALQRAIDQGIKNGGATIILPIGAYSIGTVTIAAGEAPISIVGGGSASIVLRRGKLAEGAGLFDVWGSNVSMESFVIDGGVTVPEPRFYNLDFMAEGKNEPMADSLARNTSVWVHGPASGFSFRRMRVTHTGGYAVLLDARSGQVSDVQIAESLFDNNRPHLFGAPGGPAIYGAWTGGVFATGDGRGAKSGNILKRFHVRDCRFLRNNGNCLWSHIHGFDGLHEDFHFLGCYFLDCGLDGILIGGVTGGAVGAHVFRRIGYATLTDTDRSVPRWLPNLNATAIDSSGIVKGVPYFNNSMCSINGGCLDLDGHGDSAITGNTCRVPYPEEPEYAEDRIAISGPLENGSASYGLNLGNSSDTPCGGRNVNITGNTFINLSAGALRLFGARDCHVTGNDIIVPDQPTYPPIAYGPLSESPNRRARGNVIRHNRIKYSPSEAAPAIYEDGQYSPFTADDVNYVFGNGPIIGNGNAVEFQKDPNSGSPEYAQTVWFPRAV